MFRPSWNWLRRRYRRVLGSIAFLPALITFGFLLLSFLMIAFDFSDTGKSLKASLSVLSLRDADTARNICTAIAGGIISLAVFSFSMVMIVLNQAASQMSSRILDKLIGNRFQQWVLGFYIGTIIYALFLLTTIRDIDSGISVPALSTYLLILLTVIDIFLFIYFLHYITDSIKYETIIRRLHDQTREEMEAHCNDPDAPVPYRITPADLPVMAPRSGIVQQIDAPQLARLCGCHGVVCFFPMAESTYVLSGTPLFYVCGAEKMPPDFESAAMLSIDIGSSQRIDLDFHNGFRQLMEISLRAISPGINDPDTAVLALQALFDLFDYRCQFHPATKFAGDDGNVRVIKTEPELSALVKQVLWPIWDYGKNDRLVRGAFQDLLRQFSLKRELPEFQPLESAVSSFIT